jgi:hypothetical protein
VEGRGPPGIGVVVVGDGGMGGGGGWGLAPSSPCQAIGAKMVQKPPGEEAARLVYLGVASGGVDEEPRKCHGLEGQSCTNKG